MEIKPCPFCGGSAAYTERTHDDGICSYTAGSIRCSNKYCGCKTPEIVIDGYLGFKTKKKDVFERWNHRA